MVVFCANSKLFWRFAYHSQAKNFILLLGLFLFRFDVNLSCFAGLYISLSSAIPCATFERFWFFDNFPFYYWFFILNLDYVIGNCGIRVV